MTRNDRKAYLLYIYELSYVCLMSNLNITLNLSRLGLRIKIKIFILIKICIHVNVQRII